MKYLIFFGLFLIVGMVLIWFKIKTKKPSTNQVCDLYFFYTSWCPYCKRARVEWDKVKSVWKNKTINGYTIQFQEIDCDVNETLASKYDVTKYPTIKLIKDNMTIDFDANPTTYSLTSFLQSSFN